MFKPFVSDQSQFTQHNANNKRVVVGLPVNELLIIDDVIKGFRDVPDRYYANFMGNFVHIDFGTTQEFFITKDSVRRWFFNFSEKERATFRDAGYIQKLLDEPSFFSFRNKSLLCAGRALHEVSKEPFEHYAQRVDHQNKFREELLEDKRKLEEGLKVSTAAESKVIEEHLALTNEYLEKVNAIYNPAKLAHVYRGMGFDEDPVELFEKRGGDVAYF